MGISPGITGLMTMVIAGFITMMSLPHARYWSNRQEGYKMFFAVLTAGFFVVQIARLFAAPATEILSNVGVRLPPAPNEAVFDVVWSVGLNLYLFGQFNVPLPMLRRLRLSAAKQVAKLSGDLIEHLLQEAVDKRFIVELTMENGKVYIGHPVESGVATSAVSDVSLIPLFSGYRDHATKELTITTSYRAALQSLRSRDDLTVTDFQVLLPKDHIQSARRFDPDVYLEGFQSLAPAAETPQPPALPSPPD